MQFFRQIEGRIFEKNFISAKNYHIFFEKRLKLFYLYIRGFPPFFFFRKTFIKKMQTKRIYFLKSRTIKKNNMRKKNIKQAGGKKILNSH